MTASCYGALEIVGIIIIIIHSSSWETPFQNYRVSLPIWDHAATNTSEHTCINPS